MQFVKTPSTISFLHRLRPTLFGLGERRGEGRGRGGGRVGGGMSNRAFERVLRIPIHFLNFSGHHQ